MQGTAGMPKVKAKPLTNVNAYAPPLSIEARKKLYEKRSIKTKTLENNMGDRVQTHLTRFGKEFLAEMAEQWKKEDMGPLDFDPTLGATGEKPKGVDKIDYYNVNGGIPEYTRISYNIASQADFQTNLEDWESPTYDTFEADITDDLVEAWRLTTSQQAKNMGQTMDPDALIDEETLAQIKANGKKLAKDLFGTQHKAIMNQISEGIRAGKGYKEISDLVSQEVFAGTKNIPATVQKYVHTESALAQIKTMKSMGATRFVYLTANDGNVRDEHAALESREGDESDFIPYLSEFGCRCTLIPRTIWDDIVEEENVEVV